MDFLSLRLGSSVHNIRIPSRTTGAAPVKLGGQNPGHETPDSALSECIGWTSGLALRPESKGIASRLGGRWPLLALSIECRLKSFATADPSFGATLNVNLSPDITEQAHKLRLHNRRRWWSQLYDTCSANRLLVWDFLIAGNTKSVTIGIPALQGNLAGVKEGRLLAAGQLAVQGPAVGSRFEES